MSKEVLVNSDRPLERALATHGPPLAGTVRGREDPGPGQCPAVGLGDTLPGRVSFSGRRLSPDYKAYFWESWESGEP